VFYVKLFKFIQTNASDIQNAIWSNAARSAWQVCYI